MEFVKKYGCSIDMQNRKMLDRSKVRCSFKVFFRALLLLAWNLGGTALKDIVGHGFGRLILVLLVLLLQHLCKNNSFQIKIFF